MVWSLAKRVMPGSGARPASLHHVHRASSSFVPSMSARVSALRKVLGRLKLRHGDLRAWSSLRLDPKLRAELRQTGWPARSIGCASTLRATLSSTSGPSVPDLLSPFASSFLLACSTFFLPTTSTSLHFVHTSQPFTHHSGSLYKLTSYHHHLRHFAELSSTHPSSIATILPRGRPTISRAHR